MLFRPGIAAHVVAGRAGANNVLKPTKRLLRGDNEVKQRRPLRL